MRKIKITQIKSGIDRPERQKLTLKALGLNKMHASREVTASPQILGMVRAVTHLLKVEEVQQAEGVRQEAVAALPQTAPVKLNAEVAPQQAAEVPLQMLDEAAQQPEVAHEADAVSQRIDEVPQAEAIPHEAVAETAQQPEVKHEADAISQRIAEVPQAEAIPHEAVAEAAQQPEDKPQMDELPQQAEATTLEETAVPSTGTEAPEADHQP